MSNRDEMKGRVEEAVGDLKGDKEAKRKGKIDRAAGAAKGAVDKGAEKAKNAADSH
jgi:uncharacterized protein YjbJ (UPF0337 family)